MDRKERGERETKRLKGDELVAYHLSALRLAIIDVSDKIQQLSENTGKWLAAVALAASTPQDNSAEVQKTIDRYVSELNASSAKVEDSINQSKGE